MGRFNLMMGMGLGGMGRGRYGWRKAMNPMATVAGRRYASWDDPIGMTGVVAAGMGMGMSMSMSMRQGKGMMGGVGRARPGMNQGVVPLG